MRAGNLDIAEATIKSRLSVWRPLPVPVSGVITIDWVLSDHWYGRLPSGETTFVFENVAVSGTSEILTLRLSQPASGAAGTVAWPTGVGTLPTLSTVNDAIDLVSVALAPDGITYDVYFTAKAVAAEPATPVTGDGLAANYYPNVDFTGTPVSRVDPTVDFIWEQGSPAVGIPTDLWSVRWLGQILAPFSETYTFYVSSDDGCRLWVNGVLVIDQWVAQPETEVSGSIALLADTYYEIRLDYFDNILRAAVHLLWSSPSITKAIIPQAQLFSGRTDVTKPTVTMRAPASGATGIDVAGNVTIGFSEPIQSGTLSFVLKDPSNATVPSAVTYDAGYCTATLNPTSNLTASTVYTATVSAVQDIANNVIEAPVVWSFTTGTTIVPVTVPTLLRQEVVTSVARTIKLGMNAWGPHKLRLIRLSNDVVYACWMQDSGSTAKWNLSRRNANGTWTVVASRDNVTEVPNLMRGPQDQIYIQDNLSSQPIPYLTSSTDGTNFNTQAIPGSWPSQAGNYWAATIAPNGDLYVLGPDSSLVTPFPVYVAWRTAADGTWHFRTFNATSRYTYQYMFASSAGAVWAIGLRDVRYSDVPGYTVPASGDDWVHNIIMAYYTPNIATTNFTSISLKAVEPSVPGEVVMAYPLDVYMDTTNRIHVNYIATGGSFGGGSTQYTQAYIANSSCVQTADVSWGTSPGNAGQRFLRSPVTGNFWMMTHWHQIMQCGVDGTTLGSLASFGVNTATYPTNDRFEMAVPRGGNTESVIWDYVYPSGTAGEVWVYVRFQIP